jgi:hypothetical protein
LVLVFFQQQFDLLERLIVLAFFTQQANQLGTDARGSARVALQQ